MGESSDREGQLPRARRYALELPVELGPLHGTTRDISVSGIRFETAEPETIVLHAGEEVRVVLRFPSTVHGRDCRLHVIGRVVRVETMASGQSIALATEEFHFGDLVAGR